MEIVCAVARDEGVAATLPQSMWLSNDLRI